MKYDFVIVNPYNSRKILGSNISSMALKKRYYNSIKFMVHMSNSSDTRKMMISQISRANPYLCAQIIMTICEDTKEEEAFLISLIEEGLKNTSTYFKKALMLMGLLELEQYDKFFEEYSNNRDLFEQKKILYYFVNNLSAKQQLIVIQAFVQNHDTKHINRFIHNFEKKYNYEYKNDVLNCAKQMANQGLIQYSYNLLVSAKLEPEIDSFLEENMIELENYLSNKTFFLNSNEYNLYLLYKYGIKTNNINNLEMWNALFNDGEWKTNTKFFRLVIKKYLNEGTLNNDTIIFLLDHLGADRKNYNSVSAQTYLRNFLENNNIFIEPFYSSMKSEEKIIALLDNPNFYNPFEFSLERLNINTNYDKNKMSESYDYFDECFSNYKNVENIIRVYFNTPLKKIVNIEYLLTSIYKRFNCDERRLKYLLGDYVFKGKVCQVNEKSVSIRAFNVWTTRSCRLNTKRYWVNDETGQPHQLKVGDILFFKFAYITSDGKIFVHFPELSLTNLREKENYRRQKNAFQRNTSTDI